jgi:hypothetical protein
MNYNLKTENNAVIFKIPASYWGDKFVTMKINIYIKLWILCQISDSESVMYKDGCLL